MNTIPQREVAVRRCLCNLNKRGWICVPEAVRMLKRVRSHWQMLSVDAGDSTVLSLFSKERPWYFGEGCSSSLLSALFQSVVEFLFDVDVEVCPDHPLVFRDGAGNVFEVTDKWLDYWFVIIGESDGESECTVPDLCESLLTLEEMPLSEDWI